MSSESALFQKFGKDVFRGEVLFREGDKGSEMYVLQAGKIAITKRIRDVEQVIVSLGPGEFFGEMAIISNRPRNASATVEEDGRVLVIDSKTFETMIRGNSEIAFRMIKKLAERLSDADGKIENLLPTDPRGRVISRLLRRSQTHGKPVEEGIEVDLGLRDAPSELGVPDSVVKRTLKDLQALGIVDVHGQSVVIVDTARLFEYGQYLEVKWKVGDW